MRPSASRSDAISEAVRALIVAVDVPGAAVALVEGGVSCSVAVGFRDLERRRPLDAGSRFYLYSVTKMLLAVAVLRLVEQGRVALDQPIPTVLPELDLDAPITLRQLLNHTSGLPDYGAMPEYANDLRTDPGAPWTPDEFLDRTLRRGLRFPPGQGWAYSNVGFLLVRRIVERLTRRSLRDALAHLVFAPLGLLQTTVAASLADAHGLTPGYSAQIDGDGALHDVSRRYHPGWVAHGVAVSTASELARIVDALFVGQLLAPGSLAAMLEAVDVPGRHPPFVRPAYGLGLMVDLGSPHGRIAGHAGGGPGYATAAFHFPDVAGRRLAAVALANRDRPDVALEIAFSLGEIAGRHWWHG